jgi:trimeric autotransporter adhesin
MVKRCCFALNFFLAIQGINLQAIEVVRNEVINDQVSDDQEFVVRKFCNHPQPGSLPNFSSTHATVLYGGTGLTTFGGAGRVLYSTSASSLAALTLGSNGQVLTSNGTSPVWANNVSNPVLVSEGGTGLTTLGAAGKILFSTSASALAGLTIGSTGQVLTVASGLPSWSANFSSPAAVAEGGTGNATLTNHGVLLGQGASSIISPSLGTAGALLLSAGASADPAFIVPTVGTGLTLTTNATTLQYALTTPVTVANGGTGATTLTQYGVLLGNGTSAIAATSAGTAGQGLISSGSSANPTWSNLFPGYVSGSFAYAGSTSTAGSAPSNTMIINITAPASITTSAIQNTALGVGALSNITGGTDNTAVGYNTLNANTTGSFNTACGSTALQSVVTGSSNTAVGYQALLNYTGSFSTAVGGLALKSATSGSNNVALGYQAGLTLTTGDNNTIIGEAALKGLISGSNNVAVGYLAGAVCTGSNNTMLGASAGSTATTGSNNLYLGYNCQPILVTESNTTVIGTSSNTTKCYIRGIRGITTGNADAVAVYIDSAGQLGTVNSSRRFKENIEQLKNEKSNQLLKLNIVKFNYIGHEKDPVQYGVIAEEVAEVMPEIVVYDKDGLPETVQYHVLVPLLVKQVQIQDEQAAQREQKIAALQATLAALLQRIAALEVRV